MKEAKALNNRVVEIDLGMQSFEIIEVSSSETHDFIGAKGLALKLLYDRLKPGSDPLGPQNMLVIHTGAFMGTGAPCSGRFSAVTKSPQTGLISSSSCGGPFGMALKTSGWDGLILKGTSTKPVSLYIDSDGVVFNDASDIWGKDVDMTIASLNGSGGGSMVIGPAGENMVSYANIASGHRFFGRSGFGAVMGSKKVKAIVAKGDELKIVPYDTDLFRKARKAFNDDVNRNSYTSKEYRKKGTASIVKWSVEKNMLPVNNFRDGRHHMAGELSGENMEEKHIKGHSACKPCSIQCGHRGLFNKKEQQVPEYETLGMLGSNLGIFDPEKVAEWNSLCRLYGMDTISTGSTLGWVMEATEKGLYKSDLKFGSSEHVSETLRSIGLCSGSGAELGKGTRWLSEKYGGSDFAIHVKGLELAAYDPRGAYGHGLGLAIANRGGDHLSANMMFVEAFMGLSFRYATRSTHVIVAYAEDLFALVNSFQTCVFTAFAAIGERPVVKIVPRFILRLALLLFPSLIYLFSLKRYSSLYVAVTGIKMSDKQLLKAGQRINTLERYMSTLEGISSKDDRLPYRLVHEKQVSETRKRKEIPLKRMLQRYYRLRGYDRDGILRPKTVENLKIRKFEN